MSTLVYPWTYAPTLFQLLPIEPLLCTESTHLLEYFMRVVLQMNIFRYPMDLMY